MNPFDPYSVSRVAVDSRDALEHTQSRDEGASGFHVPPRSAGMRTCRPQTLTLSTWAGLLPLSTTLRVASGQRFSRPTGEGAESDRAARAAKATHLTQYGGAESRRAAGNRQATREANGRTGDRSPRPVTAKRKGGSVGLSGNDAKASQNTLGGFLLAQGLTMKLTAAKPRRSNATP